MIEVGKNLFSNRVVIFDDLEKAWSIRVGRNIIPITSETTQASLAVLPIMECPIEEFIDEISRIEDISEEHRFPFEKIIRAGFVHGSPHWVGCAILWLKNKNCLVKFFENELEEVSKNKNYPQETRQIAKRLINSAPNH